LLKAKKNETLADFQVEGDHRTGKSFLSSSKWFLYDAKRGRKERANPLYMGLFRLKLFEIYFWFCVILRGYFKDSNRFYSICFMNLKSHSLATHQLVIVISGPPEASVMRSVARTPAFIQLEGEDKLTRVERIA